MRRVLVTDKYNRIPGAVEPSGAAVANICQLPPTAFLTLNRHLEGKQHGVNCVSNHSCTAVIVDGDPPEVKLFANLTSKKNKTHKQKRATKMWPWQYYLLRTADRRIRRW